MIVALAAIGLAWCGNQSSQQDQSRETADAIEASGCVGFRVLRIWLPRSLEELARSAMTPSHAEFQRLLEARNQKDLWYAFTTRAYQHSGKFSDCTFVRYPHKDSLFYPELLEVLAVAAGKPSPSGMIEFQRTTVTVMSDEMLKWDPQEVMLVCLRELSTPSDRTAAR